MMDCYNSANEAVISDCVFARKGKGFIPGKYYLYKGIDTDPTPYRIGVLNGEFYALDGDKFKPMSEMHGLWSADPIPEY